ncbi:MAG: ankyrin repeat domain-containing protein, partial [Janthinobacterium lividum]
MLRDNSIKQGGNVNARDTRLGTTALLCAARRGHADIVALLMKAGADPAVREKYGDAALMEAVRNGHTAVVRALLEADAGQVSKERSQEKKEALADAI